MLLLKRKNVYGWKPDLPDLRDKLFHIKPDEKLPKHVDLRCFCSAVEDQSSLGSCTANALVANLEFLMIKDQTEFKDMSRLFVYYNERVMENSVNEDSGAMIRDGIKTLVRQGCCTEKSWPYVISKFAEMPPVACYDEAMDYQITEYSRITRLEGMRSCLAGGFPFVFGFTVYDSFESSYVARTGIVNYPKFWERPLGGHAVMAVGYDDDAQRFIVRNSWGEGWGQKGYFTIPYRYLANLRLASDFWTIRTGENM